MNCDLCPEHAVVGYCEEHATELGERIDTMQDRIDVLKTALREIEAKIAETQAEALSWTESDDRLSAFKEGTNEVLYIARRALVGGA